MHIRTAIIPVAGMGTRFLPAAKAQPKEMLPVVDKPVIQYIVEEAVAAGIEEIIFVTSYGKRAIEDHFDRNFELEYRLAQKHKNKELKQISDIGRLAKFAFVRQSKPLGDGHAILSALPFIDQHEPVAVMFGDDIIIDKTPTIKQMVQVYEKYQDPVVAIVEVPRKDISRYGIIGGRQLDSKVWEVDKYVEKPKKNAPSNLGVVGHYIVTPEVLKVLAKQKPGADGEIRLADAFASYIKSGRPIYGYKFPGVRYDCGSKFGLIRASIELGLKHPEISSDLKSYLKSL
ncbi:MAG: UTP-glucose-1-phosphate uridylyltransferase [uncultured bacterium]|nr:MAG: UTP-glucose-1-phosphate uridylyltransferase [uncultured bacterium]HBD05739.1 UTP--glucose-1-phosphate uridylyltransferase [Candidatus Uhrbacteria bacterium]